MTASINPGVCIDNCGVVVPASNWTDSRGRPHTRKSRKKPSAMVLVSTSGPIMIKNAMATRRNWLTTQIIRAVWFGRVVIDAETQKVAICGDMTCG